MKLSSQQLLKFVQRPSVQLSIIVLISFLLRLYRIDNPVLDWHAFRQADTASVTYRYMQEGIDLLRPKYHDLSNIQSGFNNPEGYRMVEFPFINGLIAGLLRLLPTLDLVITSRFISIIFSLGTLLAFYWLIKQISEHRLALVSTTFLGFLPFSIYYSRVILPEPYMLFFSCLSLALFVASLKLKKSVYWWLSSLSLALALLLKPFVAFLAPLYFTLLIFYEPKFYKKIQVYLYPALAFLPLLLWRWWISNFPEGIPASDWLLNGNLIRFRPAWFRWLFWERLSWLMSGIVGVLFVIANLIKRNRILSILGSWWLGIVGFFIVVATGNVMHDYYQVIALPILALTLGRGALLTHITLAKILKTTRFKTIAGIISLSTTLFLTCTMLIISWTKIHGYFNVNHWEYLRVGQEADQLLPKEAKVIAPAMGDTMFLFQTRRNGWPIGDQISEKIELGATHYLTINFDEEAQALAEKYITLRRTSEFLIIDLTTERSP